MFKINPNFSQLSENYLFSTIARKVSDYTLSHPDCDLIRLGIGDVTLPLPESVTAGLVKASAEQSSPLLFRGYGPEQGYEFLRQAILETDYLKRGINLSVDDIFISDGAKSDLGNIGDILSIDNIVAIADPVYPVYLDTNVMAGRKVEILPCTAEYSFKPQVPECHDVDVIYLCSPNNPTGMALTRGELAAWVDYALANGSLILFDSAYEAYITSPDVPHSIYEIPGALKCAIEFRSFSKTAGFTGLRCGYTVVPSVLRDSSGISLNSMWRRRQCTKFNGASYVVQRAASALYSAAGRKEIDNNISYYRQNATIISAGLRSVGLEVYGGIDSPYVWAKVPVGFDSWQFFDILLHQCQVVCTPGVGFGSCGEGYVRFTAFNTRENTGRAINRMAELIEFKL